MPYPGRILGYHVKPRNQVAVIQYDGDQTIDWKGVSMASTSTTKWERNNELKFYDSEPVMPLEVSDTHILNLSIAFITAVL